MGTGGRVVLRRGHGGRRRRKLDGDDDDDDDDEEYVVDEEEEEDEEEDEEEIAAASSDEEGEVEVEDESDADFEEEEEFEIEAPLPKRQAKGGRRGRKGKPAGSRRRTHEEDEDYEEELEEEDEDFDPDADEEEEELEEEEDDEEFGAIRTKKIRSKNKSGKRKPAWKRQQRKNKKNGSRVSRSKARKGVPVRRRRKRSMTDDYEDEEEENEEEDEEFFVEDRVEVNQRPRKKAKIGRKTRAGPPVPVVEAETWPSLDSDTSDFEFVTSDEEFAEKEPLAAEPARIKGRKRRKKISESESSSDSDYVISEEELRDLGVIRPQEAVPLLSPPLRRTFVSRKGEEKGKEKEKEPEEAWKPTCGICLSEEQKATVQGVLNCCPHYFCFACIMEWSKVESRCPLCKRRFTTITKSSKADLGLGLRKPVIKVEKRDQVYQPSEEEMRRWLDPYENVVCIECNQGGDDNLMLLCDICDSPAHTYCVGLGREVPEGNWYCGGCRSAGEGPSYTQIQDRVVHHGESNSSHADSSSEAFSTTAPSGIFQRPPPINIHPSFQEFDLNLSPRETPEEDQRAESRVSVDAVSTPPGRRATLSGRRAIHQRIRIFLSRPRPMVRPNVWHNGVQDRTIPETEQNQWNTRAATEVNSSHSMANAIQNQQCSSPFVQPASNFSRCTYGDGNNFQQIEGAKDQVLHMVKSSLKRMHIQFPLDGHSAFKNIARRAKHTILAAYGIEHNRDMVVATHHHPPNNCCHALDGREPAFLMRNCCSLCFSSFVSDVVNVIANMFS